MSHEPKPHYQQAQSYTSQPQYNNGIASHTPPLADGHDQRYSGVVYVNAGPQQSQQPQQQHQQYQQTQYTEQTHTQHSAMSQIQPINIQPDPLPKALQPQSTVVTTHQVQSAYNNASFAYVPRLSSQDDFHYHMCACFTDFFTCKHMGTCESWITHHPFPSKF